MSFDTMSAVEVSTWLRTKGYPVEVCDTFVDQEMDGEAITAAFASTPGPDCLRDVIPKLGHRVKVYQAIKLALENQLNPLDEPGVLEKAATRGFGVREKLSTPVSSNPGSVFHSPNSVSPTPLSSVSPIPRFEDVEKASTPATEVGAGSKVAFEERASLSPVPMVFDDVSASETNKGICKRKKKEGGGGTKTKLQVRDPIVDEVKKGVPDPFPLPIFRKQTRERLARKCFCDEDRKYMVSTLGTIMMTYTDKASKSDCLRVGEALIRKYPFLKEPYSWQQFLYNKCHNITRDSTKGTSDSKPEPKRKKVVSAEKVNSVHSYPQVDVDEDKEAYDRNTTKIQHELSLPHPSGEKLSELMKRTFPERRKWVLQGAESSQQIWTKFPPLKTASYILKELEMVMKSNEIESTCQENWAKWCPAIIDYAEANSHPTNALQQALRDLPTTMTPTDDDFLLTYTHELKTLTGLRLLAHYLTIKKRGGKASDNNWCDIPYVLNICPGGTTPAECTDRANNLPHIVKIEKSDYELPPQYYISLEQQLIGEANSLWRALFLLIASHYVYNVVYHPLMKLFFLFFEEHIFNFPSINRGCKNAAYSSVVSGIESFVP